MPGSTSSSNRPLVPGKRIGTSTLTGPRPAEDFAARAKWNAANGELRGHQLAGIGLPRAAGGRCRSGETEANGGSFYATPRRPTGAFHVVLLEARNIFSRVTE